MDYASCPAPDSRIVQYDEPSWEPLENAVGDHLAAGFMWMHEEVLDDGVSVHAYKHRTTRRYLYVAETGSTYVRTRCGRLAELRLDWAIERALLSWLVYGDATDADRAAIRAALERTADPRPEVTW